MVNLSTVIQFAVVSASVSGQGILSGHADGTVVRYFFGSGESQVTKGSQLLFKIFRSSAVMLCHLIRVRVSDQFHTLG